MTGQPQQLGKYQLQRHIATGGMAEIWLAEQAGPGGFNKELVIKRILPHFADDEQFTTMFLDEARLAAQLSHPKIAQIYELGEIEGQYFIAMEYIPGIDLDVLLKMAMDTGRPIPVDIVCKVMMDVLEALDYAHEYTDRNGQPYNLVHRDVSPHNVLISNDGIVKLCDFGVAKARANQTKTQPGAVKGKFAYMSPEQIQNAHSVDRRADVFAAGIMFYELLTGVKPFGDELAAVNGIIAQTQADPRSHRPDVPAELVAVIDRALQKKPAERYPDAHSMMRDIETFVRSAGGFVGDRELSRYVREMQGLPITRHSQPSVSVTDREVDVLGDTGEQPVAKRPTSNEQVIPTTGPNDRVTGKEPTVTDEQTNVNGAGERTNTITADTAVDPDGGSKSYAGLYAVFGVVIVGVAVAIVVLALKVLPDPPDDTPKKNEPVAKTEPVEKGPKANPKLLRKPGGKPVFITTTPAAEIWVDGSLVGDTPFNAVLTPGKYDVEFRADGKVKKETFEFTGQQAMKFKL